jgi:hypothetical protein
MVAAFKSEWVAGFKSEYPAGFIGIRIEPEGNGQKIRDAAGRGMRSVLAQTWAASAIR